MSGIGFLGAGAIFFRREIVRRLTTAAGVWVVAGIGLAVGAGMYLLSLSTAMGSLLILAGFKPLEDRLVHRPERLVLHVRPESGQLPAIRHAFAARQVKLHRLTLLASEQANQETIRADYSPAPAGDMEDLIELLRLVPGVLSLDQVTLRLEGDADIASHDQDDDGTVLTTR